MWVVFSLMVMETDQFCRGWRAVKHGNPSPECTVAVTGIYLEHW